MKILVLSNLYPPNAVGGYERLTAQVASELAQRGHQVSVLTSDYGSARPGPEEIPVERKLTLLVSAESIYRPFAGDAATRASIHRRNSASLSRTLERERPEAVLIGNLYFLDASILEALRPVAERCVYLLTDVWRIHFENDQSLQDHFRRNVFEVPLRVAPLVPADPPGLVLERIASPEAHAARDSSMLQETARRRAVEAELGGGRAVFQAPGLCHLCGATIFLVRTAGPATVVLGVRSRAESTCTRCGLDGTARGALHALDLLAAPDPSDAVLVVVSDVAVRQVIKERFPRTTVVASAAELEAASPRSFQHAVWLDGPADAADAGRTIGRLASLTVPAGLVLAAGLAADAKALEPGPGEPRPPWPAIAAAREAGVPEAGLLIFWSREYGYLGREHALGFFRARAR